MTASTASYTVPTDTPATADLRATAHGAGTAACIALLLFAAELALNTLPAGAWHDQAASALALAGHVPAGKPVDVDKVIDAIQNEYDVGPLVYAQLVPPGPQAEAWNAVAGTLGYAAWHECQRRGQHPNSLIEGYVSPDALDFTIDSFVGVPGLDWAALGRATAWVREHASKASEGWGGPLKVDNIRHAAFPEARRANRDLSRPGWKRSRMEDAMGQAATEQGRDEADARRVAGRLGGALPLFRPVLRDAQAFWSPGLPPATVLLGGLGQAFAAAFHTLGAEDRATVARIVETAMGDSDYVSTAVATGFLEAAIHRAETDGTWPDVAAALGPQSLAFAEAYRSHPFHGLDAEAAPVPDDRAPGMSM